MLYHIETIQDKDKLLTEMTGVLQEMKAIPYLEVLVDDNHLIIKDRKLLEEEGQMDHLMEILEIMDPLVMKDILQDENHQEEVDLQDHHEEDHLVPLEILHLLEIKDLQAPLDHEDLLDYKDLWDYKVHLDKSSDSLTYLELLLCHR